MRVRQWSYLLPVFLLVFAISWSAPLDIGPTYAVRNAKIVPVTGPVIDKGTLIIRDGLIEAVGAADKVVIPEDAEVFEAEGLIAYPGLISAHTNLFLEETAAPARVTGESAPGPAELMAGAAAQPQSPQNADLIILKNLKPRKSTLDGFLKAGFTTVLVAPNRGIFQGQSVIVNLNGEEPGPMVVKNPAALHINFTTNRGGYPSSLMGTIAYIRQSFLDADHYAAVQTLYAKNLKGMKRPGFDPFLEALIPYLKDRKPVVFQCNNYEEIKRALKIIEEFKLNAMLTHLNEAWRDADILKKAALPLLVTLDFRPPNGSRYVSQGEDLRKKAEAEIYPANAANLARAGLKFALTTFGLNDAATALKNIQTAIKAGLPREEALKALTIQPALFLGLAQQLGSLEPGKIANVILTKGEMFEDKTQVDKVFVDGVLWKF
jgi:imidazolonepropionase-like amidohydrolase